MRLIDILMGMSKEQIIAFILWCDERNTKVSTVSHCLWMRHCRELRGE
jgi:hypothetical protein